MAKYRTSDVEPPTAEDARWAAALEAPKPRRALGRVRRKRSSEITLYQVPRRFDIATLLVVSLAYSLFFTFLRVLDSTWPVYAFFGGLSVVVGVAQTLFPFGNEPRLASMVAGAGYCVLWSIAGGVVSGDISTGVCSALGSLLVGPPLGYAMGAAEAGVFLVADKVRRRWLPERKASGSSAVDFESIDS